MTAKLFDIPSFSMRAFALEGIMQDEKALAELTLIENDNRGRLTVLKDFIDEIGRDGLEEAERSDREEQKEWVRSRMQDLKTQAVRNYVAGRLNSKYQEI